MEWLNAEKDGLPKDTQEIVISLKGIYYLAAFNAADNSFRIKDSGQVYTTEDTVIYWMEIPFESK